MAEGTKGTLTDGELFEFQVPRDMPHVRLEG